MIVKKKRIIALAVAIAVLIVLVVWTAWGNTALKLNYLTEVFKNENDEKIINDFISFHVCICFGMQFSSVWEQLFQ